MFKQIIATIAMTMVLSADTAMIIGNTTFSNAGVGTRVGNTYFSPRSNYRGYNRGYDLAAEVGRNFRISNTYDTYYRDKHNKEIERLTLQAKLENEKNFKIIQLENKIAELEAKGKEKSKIIIIRTPK